MAFTYNGGIYASTTPEPWSYDLLGEGQQQREGREDDGEYEPVDRAVLTIRAAPPVTTPTSPTTSTRSR
ncbi:hypothetical protein, partial [Streptomyces zaomyceticus]|uniref:hypothetical protein n=1 Tax=Streptomyces zaomyceticus TaxID=68286 RepID=UPI00369D29D8